MGWVLEAAGRSVRLIQTVLSPLPRVSLVYSEYLRALGLISLKELSQSPVIRGVLQADRCPWERIPVSSPALGVLRCVYGTSLPVTVPTCPPPSFLVLESVAAQPSCSK